MVRQNNCASRLYCRGLLVVTESHPGCVKRGIDAWGSDFCRKWLCFLILTSNSLIKKCSASLLQTWTQVERLLFRHLALSNKLMTDSGMFKTQALWCFVSVKAVKDNKKTDKNVFWLVRHSNTDGESFSETWLPSWCDRTNRTGAMNPSEFTR